MGTSRNGATPSPTRASTAAAASLCRGLTSHGPLQELRNTSSCRSSSGQYVDACPRHVVRCQHQLSSWCPTYTPLLVRAPLHLAVCLGVLCGPEIASLTKQDSTLDPSFVHSSFLRRPADCTECLRRSSGLPHVAPRKDGFISLLSLVISGFQVAFSELVPVLQHPQTR